MAVRIVRTIGDPILREPARPVDVARLRAGSFDGLITDLIDTMHAEGGIGIAAPQIGESVRVAVIEIEPGSERYPDMTPTALTTFVNPVITVLDPGEQTYWEGCLSVPVLRGLVARPRAVRVEYVDRRGDPATMEAEGFLATVLQHELDHLDGVLFVDRVRDTTRLATMENYVKFWREGGVADDDGL